MSTPASGTGAEITGSLSVQTGRIAQAAGGIGEVAGALATEIATMHELLAQIRHGWQSSAAAPAFLSAMQSHLQEAAALKEALTGHGVALQVAAERFAQADAELAGAVAGARR